MEELHEGLHVELVLDLLTCHRLDALTMVVRSVFLVALKVGIATFCGG